MTVWTNTGFSLFISIRHASFVIVNMASLTNPDGRRNRVVMTKVLHGLPILLTTE